MKLQFEDRATQGKFMVSIRELTLKGEGLLNGKKEMVNTIVFNNAAEQKVVIDDISYNCRLYFPSNKFSLHN